MNRAAAAANRTAAAILRPESIVGVAALGTAVLVAAWILRPFRVGLVGYDSAASVLYFQRLVSGTTLEAFVGATPKALLTGVYGIAYGLIPDWRVISWLAIGAYAGGIAGSAVLAYRLAGVAAASFTVVGLIGSAELLQDVDLAYAVSWALLSWAVAGLLLTAARPHYAWAGIALAVGGLARYETLLVAGVAAVLIAAGATLARLRARPLTPWRARAPILLGLLALPVQAFHDWLLTGNALYAQQVPVVASVSLPLVGVNGELRAIGNHYAAEPVLIALAVLGLAALALRGRWQIVAGLLTLTLGVMAFLLFLAFRHIYVSGRYIAPADLALTFAAAVGLASLRVPTIESRLRARLPARAFVVAAALAGSVAAVSIIRPFGPFDRATRSAVNANARVHRDVGLVVPDLRRVLAAAPGVRVWPTDGSPTGPMGARAILLAPILTIPQLAVDLQLPLSSLTGTVGVSIRSDGTYPRPGQVVFHQIDRDLPRAPFALFEVATPTQVGQIGIDPILVGATGSFWLVRIGP